MRFLFCVFCLVCAYFVKAQAIDVLHYAFEIKLSDSSDAIHGQAQIVFARKAATTKLVIDLTGNNGNEKGMKVDSVMLRSGKWRPLSFIHANDKLIVSLPASNRSDTQTISISYSGIPVDGLIIARNKYGERTFFADNWPNRAHHWIPCVDRPDDKASFEFSVIAPAYYKIISNGEWMGEYDMENGYRKTYWKEDVPLSTKVMVIGAASFAVKTFDDSPKGIPVSAWVYAQDSVKGFYDYAVAPSIVRFFSSYIAPFPYNKLANVQSKTIFGGMENASCIFYAEDLVTGNRKHEDVVAHEIAHQWFGDMASEKSFAHLWLSEGFATYFTDLYFEKTYGHEAFLKRIRKEREDVIAFVNKTTHAVVDTTSNLMSLLNANSYQKGAWVLHMLRCEVGDSLFQKIIQTYYLQYKGSNADTRDFEQMVERVTGKNWKWFFDQWLYSVGVPRIEIRWEAKSKKLTVLQLQENLFHFPLEISFVKKGGGSLVKKFMINQKQQDFIVEGAYAGQLTIDPDTKLLFSGVVK